MHKIFVLQQFYFMPLHVLSTCRGTRRPPRDCVMQFWPPDDEHMCSKHVEVWNKLIVKKKICASSWLITEINILRCTVSKTSKNVFDMFRTSKCSSSGRLVYAVLWHFIRASNISSLSSTSFHRPDCLIGWTLGYSKHVEDTIIKLQH